MNTKPNIPSGVEAAVCEDIARRQQLGIQKYGGTVADNPAGLHEWLQHAYEECLDQAVYLKRAMVEITEFMDERDALRDWIMQAAAKPNPHRGSEFCDVCHGQTMIPSMDPDGDVMNTRCPKCNSPQNAGGMARELAAQDSESTTDING